MLKLGTTNISLPFSKAYLGSVLKYQKIVNTEFTACPFPTSWTEVVEGLEYTATNDYGTWRIWSDTCYSASSNVSYAFDNDTTVANHFSPTALASDEKSYMGIDLPSGVTINPTQIYLSATYIGSTSENAAIEGLNENGEWQVVTEITRRGGSSREETISISSNNFYSKFRLKMIRFTVSSSRPRIQEFQIRSGTIREEK